MSVQLGIYDFFAYTISGGLHLTWMIYLFYYRLDFQSISLTNLTVGHLLLFAIAAYVIGLVTDPIGRQWERISGKKRYAEALKALNERNPYFEFQGEKMDWFIVLNYLRQQNMKIAESVERLNVTKIMLRNVSLNFALFAIFALIEALTGSSTIVFSGLVMVFAILSILALREADKYRNWFYSAIFQSTASFMIEKEQLPIRVSQKTNKTKSKNQHETHQAVEQSLQPTHSAAESGISMLCLWNDIFSEQESD